MLTGPRHMEVCSQLLWPGFCNKLLLDQIMDQKRLETQRMPTVESPGPHKVKDAQNAKRGCQVSVCRGCVQSCPPHPSSDGPQPQPMLTPPSCYVHQERGSPRTTESSLSGSPPPPSPISLVLSHVTAARDMSTPDSGRRC